MKEIQLNSWTEFKEICLAKKKLKVQCVVFPKRKEYHIFAVEDRIYWFVNLFVEEDIADFEKNYRKGANRRISGK